MVQPHGVDGRVDAAAGQQRRQSGRKAQAAAHFGDIQGLDAQPVAAQQHLAARLLPDGKGEHAVQALHEVFAPGVVGLEQHLGVAVRVELVALGLQLAAQLRVVVDGAVEHQPQAQLGVEHRLGRARRQVHDLQAPVSKAHRVPYEQSARIRPARCLDVGHARQRRHVNGDAVEPDFSCNATHAFAATFRWSPETAPGSAAEQDNERTHASAKHPVPRLACALIEAPETTRRERTLTNATSRCRRGLAKARHQRDWGRA